MMNKDTIEISSLYDFIHHVSLQKGTSFHSRTTNFRPIYRGQANREWSIEPGVYRNGRFSYEMNYIREMERLEPDEFSSLSRIEKLIKMQQYPYSSARLYLQFLGCIVFCVLLAT